ncbi:MAG: hypothetical protein COC06_10015 [Bacteroidales bacterium]|nr:MAG: hypothetical protein COC06_10015 [Bacteroidales bacterium]
MEKIFVVKFTGPFGFIKPWTAVRDSETYSQQFLTPSIVAGMERKLFPELLKDDDGEIKKIIGHRLSYCGLSTQQERTWSKGGISIKREKGVYKTNQGIIDRGIMLEPHLHLAFFNKNDAEIAFKQSICLCRNEDILLPESILEMDQKEFNLINGFELIFTDESSGFKVGHNRFKKAAGMYGELKVFGNPIRN